MQITSIGNQVLAIVLNNYRNKVDSSPIISSVQKIVKPWIYYSSMVKHTLKILHRMLQEHAFDHFIDIRHCRVNCKTL